MEREERLSGSSRSEPEVPAEHLNVFGYMGTSSVCLFPVNMGQFGGQSQWACVQWELRVKTHWLTTTLDTQGSREGELLGEQK